MNLLPTRKLCDNAAPAVVHQRLVQHLDLFSGIGGFALAARMVGGIETVGFCEKDPWARKVLTKNFPGVPICEDIREVNGTKYGNIDIITGGFPCQPFSQSNTRSRKGVEDSRYLWPQMFRVIGEAGPTFVVAENSPDIEKFALEQVQSDLDSIGYDSIPVEIPAAGVGANHLRRRLWILAHARCVDAGQWRPRPAKGQETTGLHWWDAYPGIHGVDDGLSRRMDGRKRMLGNAIVPQVAAEILRAMMHALSLHNVQAHPLGGAAGDSNEAYGGPGVTCAGGSKPAPTDRLADGMTGPAAAMLHQSPTELGAAPLFASGSRGGGNSAN